ncbi:MAG: arsenate reductase ArsC [Massilia sp.]
MNEKVRNVLFVCSGNSGRSIMAESILGQLGQGQFRAFSAGSHPTGRVNPLAIEQLALRGYPTRDLASKSWQRFLAPESLGMDFVITVCALAAREEQPCWPGNPETLFWRFRAPGAVQGSDQVVRQAFSDVCDVIEESIKLFVWQNSVQSHLTDSGASSAAA